jgi:translation initiation factor IF-3
VLNYLLGDKITAVFHSLSIKIYNAKRHLNNNARKLNKESRCAQIMQHEWAKQDIEFSVEILQEETFLWLGENIRTVIRRRGRGWSQANTRRNILVQWKWEMTEYLRSNEDSECF